MFYAMHQELLFPTDFSQLTAFAIHHAMHTSLRNYDIEYDNVAKMSYTLLLLPPSDMQGFDTVSTRRTKTNS